jgi:crotonobetainyl-CoA:carnitine CoA-transferase CaiB-like acyl-CoA transferase
MYINIYRDLMQTVNRPMAVSGEIHVKDTHPVTNTLFQVDNAATACYMANATLLNDIWELRTGKRQKITIDQGHAALSLVSFMLVAQNDHPIGYPDRHRIWPNYPIMDSYKTRDGRRVYIDGVYPHLRDGLLDLLNCPNNALALAAAVAQWNAQDLEDQINRRGLCGTIVRTCQEWRDHPQGKILEKMPPTLVEKRGNTAPVPFAKGSRPLEGVKVLDFTHVLAGPMSTRALAEQGAEVLHLCGSNVPELLPFAMDTGHGKKNAIINLDSDEDRKILINLIKEADIFVQGYAPGKFKSYGFGPEEVHAINPKTIYTTVSCFGTTGPWATYKGFEQLAQAATGLMADHSSLEDPHLVPAAVCDYLTGYLCSLGMLTALYRRATEGGSYNVEVALGRTAMMIDSYGLRQDKEIEGKLPANYEKFFTVSSTSFGNIKHLLPVIEMSETKGRWEIPLSPLESGMPEW